MFDQSCGSVLCVEGSRKRARTERVGVSYAQRYGGRPSRLNEANSPSQPGCFPLGCQCSLCCVSLGSVPLSPSPSLQVPVQSVPVEPSLSVYVCVCVCRGVGAVPQPTEIDFGKTKNESWLPDGEGRDTEITDLRASSDLLPRIG